MRSSYKRADFPAGLERGKYLPALKTGQCTGLLGAGKIVHLVSPATHGGPYFAPALCGTRPGALSAGWNTELPGLKPTCRRCIERLPQPAETPNA